MLGASSRPRFADHGHVFVLCDNSEILTEEACQTNRERVRVMHPGWRLVQNDILSSNADGNVCANGRRRSAAADGDNPVDQYGGAGAALLEENDMTTDRQYRDLARWRYSRANCDIEITNNAQVTPVGDAGAFVAAWVWVPKASPGKLQARLQPSATRGILFIGEWMEAMGFDTDQKLADKMGGTT